MMNPILDRETLLAVTSEVITSLQATFRATAPGDSGYLILIERLEDMARLHNDLLNASHAPPLKGYKRPPEEWEKVFGA